MNKKIKMLPLLSALGIIDLFLIALTLIFDLPYGYKAEFYSYIPFLPMLYIILLNLFIPIYLIKKFNREINLAYLIEIVILIDILILIFPTICKRINCFSELYDFIYFINRYYEYQIWCVLLEFLFKSILMFLSLFKFVNSKNKLLLIVIVSNVIIGLGYIYCIV